MADTPYQRDYLQITGVLTTAGALIFGLFFAAGFAKRGVLPADASSLVVLTVLAALIAGGAALARARLWGGALLAAGYVAIAVWQLRLAIHGMRYLPVTRLLGMIALAALMVIPAALVIRWRRFLR